MKCPLCPDTTLVIADRQGIEIDYCPSCRGVWLDRGELDKLIERATAALTPPTKPTPAAPMAPAAPSPSPTPTEPAPRPLPWYDDDWDDDRGWSAKGKPHKTKKRKAKSLFEEIFDF